MTIGRVPGVTGIQPSIVDAKGDLIVATAADSVDRLAVGSNNQVLTVDSSTATGLKWATPAAGGKILQVVHGSTSTRVSNSTNVQADTTLTATITPSSTSSRILVLVSHNSNGKTTGSGGNNNAIILKLYRGSTEIGRTGGVNFIANVATNIESVLSSASFNVVDSPNTTSPTTYKTMFHAANNGPAVVVQESFGGQWDSTSYITLLEIGA